MIQFNRVLAKGVTGLVLRKLGGGGGGGLAGFVGTPRKNASIMRASRSAAQNGEFKAVSMAARLQIHFICQETQYSS